MKKHYRVIAAAVAMLAMLLAVYASGVVRAFHITGASMTPEIVPGDYVVMERFAFSLRKPRRGDLVVFKADRLPPLPDGIVLPKRLVGLPGDHLRLADVKLYVNEQPVPFRNRHGEIPYVSLPGSAYLASASQTVTVPEGHYVLLGDNSVNSLDSRICGFVSAESILGRMWLCYWPPKDTGFLR